VEQRLRERLKRKVGDLVDEYGFDTVMQLAREHRRDRNRGGQ
jgi:hypothetical protein